MSKHTQALADVRAFILFAAQVGRASLVGDCDDLPGPSDCERLASGTELITNLDSISEEIEQLKDLLMGVRSLKDDATHAFEVKAEYCDRVEAHLDELLETASGVIKDHEERSSFEPCGPQDQPNRVRAMGLLSAAIEKATR